MENHLINWDWLGKLVAIDSPTGFTDRAADYVVELLSEMGWSPRINKKGGIHCPLGNDPKLVIAAHIDTLGGIVQTINENGSLGISKIGGPNLASYEGSNVRIITLDQKLYTGSLLLNNPSTHVNRTAESQERTTANMHIRIDEPVASKSDVKKLGIDVGDIICFEPYFQILENGYIKSKFMDNKAGCMSLFLIAEWCKKQNKNFPVELYFSNYEEVGHGSSIRFDEAIAEMLVVDMGIVGEGSGGNERLCSICAKDATGPYDYSMRKKLVEIAKSSNINYVQDIYPYYGSDGSAALRAGNDFKVALIGPGVSASHGIERAHKDGIIATAQLCIEYIQSI